MSRRRVDLPQPLWPTTLTNSPVASSRSTPANAWTVESPAPKRCSTARRRILPRTARLRRFAVQAEVGVGELPVAGGGFGFEVGPAEQVEKVEAAVVVPGWGGVRH